MREHLIPTTVAVPSAQSREVVAYTEISPPDYDVDCLGDRGNVFVTHRLDGVYQWLADGSLVVTPVDNTIQKIPGSWIGFASTSTMELRDALDPSTVRWT